MVRARSAWLGLLLLACLRPTAGRLFPLHIGGFHSRQTLAGKGVAVAAQLALRHVNRDPDVLRDFRLLTHWNDTECDMATASRIFFEMMYDAPQTVMLFGDACSHVTAPIAETSRYWNIWQLSYADTDSILSDRGAYPNFFRTVPSDTDFNPARLHFIRHFNWTKIGALYQDASHGSARYSDTNRKLFELFNADSTTTIETVSFSRDPKQAIENLVNKDIRITLCNFDAVSARKVMCYAFHAGMYGPKYVWMLLGDYAEKWWEVADPDVACTPQQLLKVLDGYFATDILPLSTTGETTISNMTAAEYNSLYDASRRSAYSKYHGYAYDGIWVIALALDRVIRQDGGVHPRGKMLFRGSRMGEALNATDFIGVTGRVLFRNGDRIGNIVYQQLQDGVMKKVGEYSALHDVMDLTRGDALRWRGYGPPRDCTLRQVRAVRVNITGYVALCSVAGLGIVVAVIFLAVNIHFRKHKYIKMSSPNMNNIITVGCILTYLSVFLLGVDSSLVSPHNFPAMCTGRAWVLSIGFTLSFGAMFSKTWRVHAIFTNIKLNKKVIKDYKLFIMVAVFLVVDCMILGAWQIFDPPRRETKELQPEVDREQEDKEIIPLIEFCISEHMTMWLGAIYAYKGLLMVFGCFLAWETRHVSIPALNDSKYIGMSVYNVVIICVAGVAVSSVIKDQPDSAYLIIALFIIFCTTITLCLVFVPKIIELRRDPIGNDRRIRATLRKSSAKHEGSGMPDDIRRLISENKRYKQLLEEKKRIIEELVVQLGDDNASYDTPTKSPAHRHVVSLKTGQDRHSTLKPPASGSSDEDSSLLSTSSTANVWHLDPNGRSYTTVRANPPDIDDEGRGSRDDRTLRVGLGEHLLSTRQRPGDAPYEEGEEEEIDCPVIHEPRQSDSDDIGSVRRTSSDLAKKCASYNAYLDDIYSLKETTILSDSDSTHHLSPSSQSEHADETPTSATTLLPPRLK